MNDLQPWKIWSVTAILVCAILGSTAARVRPQPSGESPALTAEVTSAEHRTGVTIASSDTNGNQNDAYAFYTPHRSFIRAGYSSGQASAIAPLNNLLSGSRASSMVQAEGYQEPLVDVAQEIVGNPEHLTNQFAANEGQSTHNWYAPLFDTDNGQVQEDMFAAVPDDHWAYAAVSDTDQMITYNMSSPEASGFIFLDQ